MKRREFIAGLVGTAAWPVIARAESLPPFDPATFNPANPAASGFSLVFEDTFTSMSTIDQNDTGNPGYKWYNCRVLELEARDPSTIAIGTDGLILSDYGTIMTAGWVNRSSPSFGTLGKAWGNGLYAECRMMFDPYVMVNDQNYRATFYGLSWKQAMNTAFVPAAQTTTYRFPEWDIMEYPFQNYVLGEPDLRFSWHTCHDWFGPPAVPGGNDDYPNNNFSPVYYPGENAAGWHTYGGLWVPSSSTRLGLIKSYVDNQIGAGIGAVGMNPFEV